VPYIRKNPKCLDWYRSLRRRRDWNRSLNLDLPPTPNRLQFFRNLQRFSRLQGLVLMFQGMNFRVTSYQEGLELKVEDKVGSQIIELLANFLVR
jgi:hypothetical protein